MTRYIFSNGKITVEDGGFTPRPTGERSMCGVLILARDVLHQPEPEPTDESTQDKESEHEQDQ
jgi:hypothetical protein